MAGQCILVLTHSRSVFSSCAVSGSLCLVPLGTAGVAVHWIPVATPVQLAQWQGFGGGVLWWKAQQHEYVWRGRQSFVERASARHGFGSAGRVGQPLIGDCGGRPAIVPRSAACN